MIEPVSQSSLAETLRWYEARGEATPPADWFGEGYWVPGVAAVFPVFTDTPRAYIEDVVTNPAAGSAERNEALVALESFVCELAKAQGYRFVLGWSRSGDMARRAAQRGFSDLGQFHGFARRL
jgi:hypothetical protein